MQYLELVKNAEVRWPLFFAFVGRIPLYVVNLALVLWANNGSSFIISGLMVGIFNVGGAIGGIITALIADKKGSSFTLLLTGVVQSLCLLSLSTVGENAIILNVILVFIAGFFTPPISSIIRSYWSKLPEDSKDPAFAIESIAGELLSVVGPLLLSTVLLFSDSSRALVVSGLLVVVGSVALSLTKGIRNEKGSAILYKHDTGPKMHRSIANTLNVFKNKGFIGLFVRRMLEAVSNGAYDVAIPAFAIWIGSEAYSGSLYSALGIGSIVGGIAYGLHKWKMPKEQIYCWGLLLSAIGMALPLLAHSYTGMSFALGLGALSFAPVAAVEYSLIARSSDRVHRSQSFAWMTTAGVIGSAIGSQSAGIVTTYFGFRETFLLAAAISFIAALLAWPMRKYWKEEADESVIKE